MLVYSRKVIDSVSVAQPMRFKESSSPESLCLAMKKRLSFWGSVTWVRMTDSSESSQNEREILNTRLLSRIFPNKDQAKAALVIFNKDVLERGDRLLRWTISDAHRFRAQCETTPCNVRLTFLFSFFFGKTRSPTLCMLYWAFSHFIPWGLLFFPFYTIDPILYHGGILDDFFP